jgi:hypothetical protein
MIKRIALLLAALTISTAFAAPLPVKDLPQPPCYPCTVR